MRFLIVEDELLSRLVLQKLLSSYGQTDVTVNGEEALIAFRLALNEGDPYDLVCLDVLMPGLNGDDVLREMRKIEEKRGIYMPYGAKIIMTTALDDADSVMNAFKSQCEAYIIKPVTKEKIGKELKALGLI